MTKVSQYKLLKNLNKFLFSTQSLTFPKMILSLLFKIDKNNEYLKTDLKIQTGN